MKNFTFKMAAAALGLSLCFGATASASIPVALAPTSNNLAAKPKDIIIIVGSGRYYVVTRPVAQQKLENVNQSAQFDSTN